MRDPLRLDIYQQTTGRHGETLYSTGSGEWAYRADHVDQYAVEKRLSDTELAAEAYRAIAWLGVLGRTYASDEGRNIVVEAAFTFGPVTREEHEFEIINRFLKEPHYDEEQIDEH